MKPISLAKRLPSLVLSVTSALPPIRTNPSPMVENQQRVDQSLEPKCSQDCFECLPVFAGEV